MQSMMAMQYGAPLMQNSPAPAPGLSLAAQQTLLQQIAALSQDNARLRWAVHLACLPPPPGLTPEPVKLSSSPSTGPPSEGSETDSDDGCLVLSETAADGTTLTLRNVPATYNRQMFLDLLERQGFAGVVDFIYVPMNFQSGKCLRYVVINIKSEALHMVAPFEAAFQDFRDWQVSCQEACVVERTASQQGLQACIDRYRESPVNHPDMPEFLKPVIFSDGLQHSLPVALTDIKLSPRLQRLCKAYHENQAGRGSA